MCLLAPNHYTESTREGCSELRAKDTVACCKSPERLRLTATPDRLPQWFERKGAEISLRFARNLAARSRMFSNTVEFCYALGVGAAGPRRPSSHAGGSAMLRIEGGGSRYCDGITRRNFLQIGGLAMGGASLPELLRAEAQSGRRSSHKAVIMIFLSGGPPHQDLIDLKPEAPVEIRGEFSPIATNVPGIEICELLPQLASMMDKFAAIRSIVGSEGAHAAFQCLTAQIAIRSRPAAGRRLARSSPSCKARRSRQSRRSSACRPRCARRPGRIPASPATWASLTRRSSPAPRAAPTWCSTASRWTVCTTGRRCWPTSTVSAARPTHLAPCRGWTHSTSRRWAS